MRAAKVAASWNNDNDFKVLDNRAGGFITPQGLF
jgi:hypothetical protein